MRQRSQSGLTYFACLLILNILAGGAVAVAKGADISESFSFASFQTVLSKINGTEKLGALTRPGECGVGEVLCSHEAPGKASIQTVTFEVKNAKVDSAHAR